MNRGCIVVFGRQPLAGRVKTRLAAALGAATAARVYDVLLEHTVRTASSTDARVVLSLAEPPVEKWAPEAEVEVELQMEGSLGDRMRDAFQRRFGEGEDRVVIIGSDCAAVSAARLREAFEALVEGGPVLAPAVDGGYWLVAQRAPGIDLFSGVPWSTPETLRATRHRLRQLGASWHELSELRDIDTAADLEAALRDPATPPDVARRLAECLGLANSE
jgi:hypothetical protein